MNEQQKEELVRQWRDSSAKRRGIPEQMEIDEVVRDLRCVAKEGWICVTAGADLIDQLRQRAIQAEERADRYACDNNELRAKLALAEQDARRWRDRWVDYRTAYWRPTQQPYEQARFLAESEAIDLENKFQEARDRRAAIGASGEK